MHGVTWVRHSFFWQGKWSGAIPSFMHSYRMQSLFLQFFCLTNVRQTTRTDNWSCIANTFRTPTAQQSNSNNNKHAFHFHHYTSMYYLNDDPWLKYSLLSLLTKGYSGAISRYHANIPHIIHSCLRDQLVLLQYILCFCP